MLFNASSVGKLLPFSNSPHLHTVLFVLNPFRILREKVLLIGIAKLITMVAENKRLFYMLLAIPFLLLIPLVAMQFTNEVNWSLLDFLVMGILLLGAGLAGEVVLRMVKKTDYRFLLLFVILLLFLLIWAELAVGIFGTPFAGS